MDSHAVDVNLGSLYADAAARLAAVYTPGEARAIVRALLEDGFGVGINDVYAGKVRQFSVPEQKAFRSMLQRLERCEPVQYVVGRALFGPLTLSVRPGVLIPRPETLALARLAAEACRPGARVLDMGTGSGCIAIYVALYASGGRADVTALDISAEALAVARENAAAFGASIDFRQADMLHLAPHEGRRYDVIVSNPPYVCESEKAEIHRNVAGYEPARALYVSDDEPLLYYEAIARAAGAMLADGGALMVEVNSRFASDVAQLFAQSGLADAEVSDDFLGRPRFVTARRR